MGKFVITYQVDLQKYCRVRKKKYTNYSRSQLAELLLYGKVTLLETKSRSFFHFEAELIKFFTDFLVTLNEISATTAGSEEIYSLYDTYLFNLDKIDGKKIRLVMDRDRKHAMSIEIKDMLKEIKRNNSKLLEDIKILFPDYERMKEFAYLVSHLS
jgi:hypothetical protein